MTSPVVALSAVPSSNMHRNTTCVSLHVKKCLCSHLSGHLKRGSLLPQSPSWRACDLAKESFFKENCVLFSGFPGDASGKEPAYQCQCRRCKRHRFDPWVGKIPWRRKWQPTPVFLPRESHGQRSLEGNGPQGRKESDMTDMTSCMHTLWNQAIFFLKNLGFQMCILNTWTLMNSSSFLDRLRTAVHSSMSHPGYDSLLIL